MEKKQFFTLIACISTAFSINASQICKNNIAATTPDNDFTVHDQGVVTHHVTGLMWMRCSLGQELDGNTCKDDASHFNWQNALKTADGFSFAGFNDWRLPNKNELESIVEERCHSPAINSSIFPFPSSTYLDWYWSSSPYSSEPGNAWGVHFGPGSVYQDIVNAGGRVRLVRSIDN